MRIIVGENAMDQEKLAESRRLANEKRRAEAAQRRAEEEKELHEEERREQEETDKLRLDEQSIEDFERLRVQLKTFYEEISVLSKKSPDAAVNKFKLKFLNDTLKKVTAILGPAHRPFPDFEAFDDGDLTTTSDVVLMLSHYLKSMAPFKDAHTYKDEDDEKRYWYTKGDCDLEV
jgi:hypothetical protein